MCDLVTFEKKFTKENMASQNDQLIFYTTPEGAIKVEVFFQEDNFWLTQKAMSQLFGVAVPAISKHIKNIYESSELNPEATIPILETVALVVKITQVSVYLYNKQNQHDTHGLYR